MKLVVLGAGAWGTALAKLLSSEFPSLTIWGNNPVHLEAMRARATNERYLPGIKLPPTLVYEPDLKRAMEDAGTVVLAVPSKAFREVSSQIPGFGGMAVSVTKGIEHATGMTMCDVLGETMPQAHTAALSGPTLALEVARGIPTAIVAASQDPDTALQVQKLFHRPKFRVYTSNDLRGVELGGALKNVIAIAAGVCDGLGFGDNSKAALITRAMAEIRRLGVACNAHPDTFFGLSGLGDLTVTCFSKLSRNRGFGERLGRGESLAEVLSSMTAVAEGYPTTRSAYELSRRLGTTTPVIDQVYQMLYQGKDLTQGVRDLLGRDIKAED